MGDPKKAVAYLRTSSAANVGEDNCFSPLMIGSTTTITPPLLIQNRSEKNFKIGAKVSAEVAANTTFKITNCCLREAYNSGRRLKPTPYYFKELAELVTLVTLSVIHRLCVTKAITAIGDKAI